MTSMIFISYIFFLSISNMNSWDPKYEPPREPEMVIPELTDDVIKVALANFIQHSTGLSALSTLQNESNLQIISYKAKYCDITSRLQNLRTYFLKVNFQLSKENHHIKLLLKLQNQDINNNNLDKISTAKNQLFIKEIIFHGCIVPKMKDFMPSNRCELPIPDCYLAKSNDKTLYHCTQSSPCCFLTGNVDILVLEDITKEGYQPLNSYFDKAHLKLAIKSLAQLHGMSVILNRRGSSHNKSLTQIFPVLTEETYHNKQVNTQWYEQFTSALEIFSAIGPVMDEEVLLSGRDLSKCVSVMMKELWDILEDTLKPSTTHVNALCLTYCDLNSFTFSYNDQKIPVSCKIIDYQNIKFSRPVIDLVQLLYNCTQNDLQHDSLDHFIDYYHDTLLETMRISHQKYHPTLQLPSGLLSLAELKETYRECRILGAARRALLTSFACLLDYDPYTSFERNANIRFAAEDLMTKHVQLPSHSELKKKAFEAFKENPHYRVMMYRTMGDLLQCIAERTNCERIEPHSNCPHPNPQ